MKQRLLFLCWWATLLLGTVRAQSPQTQPLHQALARATTDTSRVLLLADLSASYRYSHLDSVQYYARQGLRLARQLPYPKGEGRCLSRMGMLLGEWGNLPQALRVNLQALRLNEASHDQEGTARTLNQTGLLYYALDDGRPALDYFFRAQRIYEQGVGDESQLISVLANIGTSYMLLNRLDSAGVFLRRAYSLTARSRTVRQSSWGNPLPYVLREMGLLASMQGQPEKAIRYYHLSARAAVPENDRRSQSRAYQYLAELYQLRQQPDSSIYYARKALAVGQSLPFMVGVMRNSKLLADVFTDRGQNDSTLKYMRVMAMAADSLHDPRRIKQLDAIGFAEQQRLQLLEEKQVQLQQHVRIAVLVAVVSVLALVTLLLWRRVRVQRLANRYLQGLNAKISRQATELTQQRDELGRTLQELKIAQSQLVLRERMAALGDLMNGVAQEVRRPVQRVRELAGVSEQLCQELRNEFSRCTPYLEDGEYLDEMLQNLAQHQTNIVQAGQRADVIVRGMLEYASAQPGPRQPTALNGFAEDYLRITYHDLRAKHRYLSVALFFELDPAVGSVPAVRHDLGRALIGLFSNAFYAVQQRQQQQYGEEFVPQVKLSTRRTAGQVELRVRDNGLGIPAADLPNIFQRFFTTKPAGEGTGLGLSLSYDIITRGHGGTLTVESEVGRFTEFCITLPATESSPAQP
ncbi:tetratricopeptide repeat protein [Hymenobacter sp. BT507]|uniref:histidine kinase n=1 Tax=Hymenobacter citatus TaxID=2763506 RepID=A0ABR7MIB0_9BACT|nr:ATP-binding protein [Hymenobacter citatus]MBC6610820.1 tetratricopeptide repeat protein [Hymenobacter citatus]